MIRTFRLPSFSLFPSLPCVSCPVQSYPVLPTHQRLGLIHVWSCPQVHSKKKSTYPIEKKYLAVKESHSHPVIQPCTPPWTGQRTRVGRVMPYSQIVRSIDIHRRSWKGRRLRIKIPRKRDTLRATRVPRQSTFFSYAGMGGNGIDRL